MLASRVVFFPRLWGTEQCARSPRRDHARKTEREVFAPISSTKTNRCGSELSETVTLQRRLFAIRLVLSPPQPVFWLKPILLLSGRQIVESLRVLAVVHSKK